MAWSILAFDQSDVKLFHKVSRVPLLTHSANWFIFEKDMKDEDIISQLKPYNTCYFMSAMNFFLEKVKSVNNEFCEVAAQISVIHLKSTKHFIRFIYISSKPWT